MKIKYYQVFISKTYSKYKYINKERVFYKSSFHQMNWASSVTKGELLDYVGDRIPCIKFYIAVVDKLP
jgi:hypothetical protein